MKQNKASIYVYGKHAVREIASRTAKKISKLYFKHGLDKALVTEFETIAKKFSIPIQLVDERTLDTLSDEGVHQGIVAEVKPPDFIDIKDWLESIKDIKMPGVVILDEILDPHNVGAIIRTATAVGVHGIIVGKHNQAAISGAVYKTSAGTLGKIPLIEVTNINDTITKLKEHRFWVVGLDMNAPKTFWDEAYDAPMAFVIGGEGKGVRHHTFELCDLSVRIPMESAVESLNASVSAALVLYEWKRKNKK
jgi:23S rRNA (guanosine2251-2'-O)-methyltransferase